MIDYLKLEKHFGNKDKPNFTHCIKTGDTLDYGGWEWYRLQGQHPIEMGWSESRHLFRVKGSLGYFLNGHNFTFSSQNLIDAVTFISNTIGNDLWTSEVTELEYGKIVPVSLPPKDFIRNTSGIKGYKNVQTDDYLKRFKSKFLDLKLYDAGQNIRMKKGINDRAVIKQQGWNPEGNYLKVETHYFKPWKAINAGRAVMLTDLFTQDFTDRLKEDLFLHYSRLHKMKTIIPSDNKKDLSAADILMMALAESESEKGVTPADLKASLYRRIDTLPALSKNDAKARKRQVKILIEKMAFSAVSQWDISDQLTEALNQ